MNEWKKFFNFFWIFVNEIIVYLYWLGVIKKNYFVIGIYLFVGG